MAVKPGQQGIVATEVAMGLFGFLTLLFYWMEVSYMGFVSTLVDYAASEASRAARTAPSNDYNVDFSAVINKTDSLWTVFIQPENFTLETHYFASVDSLTAACPDETPYCQESSQSEAPLAVYRVSYPYRPLFMSLLFTSDSNLSISREVITIQEYERSLFNG